MPAPTDRKYLESHEWHQLDEASGIVTIGITQFAADELTDITFVEVTAEDAVAKGEAFGEIESVKATSELVSGIDGELVEVNQAVTDDPSIINTDPHGQGWIIKVKPSDPAQLDELLDAAAYEAKQG